MAAIIVTPYFASLTFAKAQPPWCRSFLQGNLKGPEQPFPGCLSSCPSENLSCLCQWQYSIPQHFNSEYSWPLNRAGVRILTLPLSTHSWKIHALTSLELNSWLLTRSLIGNINRLHVFVYVLYSVFLH